MKIKLLSLISLVLFSCQKKEYESYRKTTDSNKIISVSLSLDSPVLIADGKAELEFKVDIYMEISDTRFVEVTEGEETNVVEKTFVDTIRVSQDRIDRDKVKIVKNDSKEVDYKYRTTEDAGTTVSFTAKYGDLVSNSREVKIIETPDLNFEPIVVPVIFHVLHKKADAYQYDAITTNMLQKMITRLNKTFAGEFINSAAGVDTKISFELVTHNSTGGVLPNKGIDRVIVPDYAKNVVTYIGENKTKLIWDPNKYLNIYVNGEEYEDDPNLCGPKYMLKNDIGLQWNSWGDYKAPRMIDNISQASYSTYGEIGIGLHRATLYQMELANNFYNVRLETLLGRFFGLVSNSSDAGDTNYCSDTYTYYDRRYNNPEKFVYLEGVSTEVQQRRADVIYYKSVNIMDKVSACKVINYEQAVRIRTVMENCPFRMMKK